MSYILYKSNGQRLVTVVDGSIDKATTDLTFVGKNYAGYGEILNQNVVKLLENFANTTEPAKPMAGQLWFDTVGKKLNLYDGVRFKPIPNFDSKTSTPIGNSKGDFWFDETTRKLKFYDGSKFVTIGPADANEFNNVQLVAATIIDSNDLNKVVLKFDIDDGSGDVKVPAVVSRDTFEPNIGDTLKSQFDYGIVQRGITLPGATVTTGDSTSLGYYFWGTAATSLGLIEKYGTVYTYYEANKYLRRTEFEDNLNSVDGLYLNSEKGLTVGLAHVLRIEADSALQQGKISVIQGSRLSFNLQYPSGGALTNVLEFAENNIIPNAAINMNLGTTDSRFSTFWAGTATVTRLNSTLAYANLFTGSLVGNVTGNVTGNLTGAIVTATNLFATNMNVTNISLSGTVTGNVSGNVTTSLISATGGTDFSPAQIRGQWSLVGNSTLIATYADIAERYHADAFYGPGTVLVVGGSKEVTVTTERASTAVAGIVSTNPAFKMNSEAGTDETHPYIALKGRVPCRVVGPIVKGELLVTSRTAGCAEAAQMGDSPTAVIGKALEDFEGFDEGIIEVKV